MSFQKMVDVILYDIEDAKLEGKKAFPTRLKPLELIPGFTNNIKFETKNQGWPRVTKH